MHSPSPSLLPSSAATPWASTKHVRPCSLRGSVERQRGVTPPPLPVPACIPAQLPLSLAARSIPQLPDPHAVPNALSASTALPRYILTAFPRNRGPQRVFVLILRVTAFPRCPTRKRVDTSPFYLGCFLSHSSNSEPLRSSVQPPHLNRLWAQSHAATEPDSRAPPADTRS